MNHFLIYDSRIQTADTVTEPFLNKEFTEDRVTTLVSPDYSIWRYVFSTWSFFLSRLPILQGGTFTLLAPSMALLSMPEWTCPAWTQNASLVNTSSTDFIEMWQSRMRAVSNLNLFTPTAKPVEKSWLSASREAQRFGIVLENQISLL